MKLFKLFFASMLAVVMTSCLGDPNNTITQDFSPYCLSYVYDTATGDNVVTSGATYQLVNNIDKGTIDIDISGVKMPDGTYIAFDVKGTRYSYNDQGAMTLYVPSTSFLAGGATRSVTDLRMEYYSRYLGNQSFPMLRLSYMIDSRYFVRVIYSPAYYWGTTTVTDQDGNVFTNTDQTSFYGVQFDVDTKKASFAALGAKFAQGMPSLNMVFKDIDYTLDYSGYKLTKAELIPTIGDTPYPSYKITDFKMEGYWGGVQYVSFTCTIDTERLKGTYRVESALQIIPANTSNQ